MDIPVVQNTIRLVDFKVTSVNLEIKNPVDENLSKLLKVNVGLGYNFDDKNQNIYAVFFKVNVDNEADTLHIDVKATAIFESQLMIDDDFRNSSFVSINSPAIAFPFVRSFINTLTTNAGINPVILPAFNFSKKE